MQLNTLGVVHEFLRRHVKEGALCIDATAGRGRDTALLSPSHTLAGSPVRVWVIPAAHGAARRGGGS